MTTPVLSVLIPAYNYASGVERILARRGPDSGLVEYIVHDDSTDDAVAALMATCEGSNISYRRNARPGSAIANWNGLLEQAQGEFIVLVHHDEFPARPGLFEDLAAMLDREREGRADIYLLGFRRLRNKWPMTNKLTPDRLRFWLLRHWPRYLAKRNFIGPSATFVVRRAMCPRFDEALTWLVDVDFYRRVLQRSDKVWGLGRFCIVSEVDREQSISKNIAPDIKAIRARDTAIISGRHDKKSPARPKLLAAGAEIVLWSFARLVGALCFGGRHGG